MTRSLPLAVAQLGPIARDEPRTSAVKRMITLLQKAEDAGSKLVVFPELALTTFFPRWYFGRYSTLPHALELLFISVMLN